MAKVSSTGVRVGDSEAGVINFPVVIPQASGEGAVGLVAVGCARTIAGADKTARVMAFKPMRVMFNLMFISFC